MSFWYSISENWLLVKSIKPLWDKYNEYHDNAIVVYNTPGTPQYQGDTFPGCVSSLYTLELSDI